MFNFWWSAKQSEWQKSTKMQKRPLSHQKMKCSFLDYVQLLMIGWGILATKVNQNAKKGPLSHQKIKCSFLDYVQLLMIGWVIWVMKVNQNAKKGPLSHQNINSHFWITFNFWWSAKQSEWQRSTKMWKRPPKSSKCEKAPKCSFLDYFQLLMIGWVILATKVNQNAKKGPLSHQNINSHFWITFNFWWFGWAIWATKVNQNVKKAPKSSKTKCSFLDYFQLLMIGWVILATKVNQNAKKGP